MVYRRRRGGRRRIGRRRRPGFGGGFGGPRMSCKFLKRKMGVAHGRRGRGKVLGMMAKAHCFRRGGGRRRGPRPVPY
jgi:hypothetical protein